MERMVNGGSGVRQENQRWSLIHGPRFLAVLLVISMIRVASTQDEMRSNLDQGLNKIRTPRYAKTTRKTNTQSNRVCNTTECIEAAIQINSSINLAVDPCDDFYEYACGKWPTNNPIPTGYAYHSIYTIAELKTQTYKKTKLESGVIKVKGASKEVQQMPSVLYASCMNLTAIENLDDEPLRERIREFGGWDMIGDWDENTWDFNKTLISIHKENGAGPFFKVGIIEAGKNKALNIHQSEPPLGKKYFLNLSSKQVVAYRQLIIDILVLLGGNESTTAKKADEIIRLDAQLANLTLIEAEWRPFETKTKTLEQLQQQVPEFNWTVYLNKLFEPSAIPQSEPIALPMLSYLKNAMKIIQNTPKRILANYMVWYVIQYENWWLAKPFRDALGRYTQAITGATSDRERWKTCIDSAFRAFSDLITAAYVQEHQAELAKRISLAKQIVSEEVQAFKDNINSLTWIDGATKSALYQKADCMGQKIGFPSYMLNSTKMASLFEKYRGLNITAATYYKNKVSFYKNKRQRVLRYLRKPRDNTLWYASPLTGTAIYNLIENEITLPAAILQPPILYPSKFLRSRIWFIGRRYDKDGKERSWWSNSTLEEFDIRLKCFEKQYSAYKVLGKWPINGKNTAEENVADNGALKIALKVYYNWVSQNPGEKWLLPGLNYTNEQLFYIGFAQHFCSNSTLQDRYDMIQSGSHTDDKFRIIGSLANSCEFANAFKCKKYSPMNPINKCYLWSKEGPLV
ncbi:endothelin-converting enzyme 1-like [Actinia tenebrosa]|uniref:Endothelin-converting enzyme 1-like n=1 Tax=Actinia tenebrosa TaxID=6105 RepID=A0A6P8HMF6_ACTTE|nr:endothelin-converting enzyme 1-like [Actinia tenebrosa]